jgi:hypothetical protein
MTAMGAGRNAFRHAGSRYRKTFIWLRRPVRKIQAEADHLREVEQAGESGETPYIVMLGLLFFLVPLFLVIVGLAFAGYYLAR